jgi:ParB family chromosome partitioning protein
MTNSIRKMRETGEVKRTDGVQARYDRIHIEPGFNLRQEGAELEESIEALTQHILDGGKYPPLEVRVRAEGGFWVVDGHRRHAAIGRALDRGAPLRNPTDNHAWIHVVVFEGNEEDRIARIITSAANKPLTAVEIAEGYKRLRAFNWTPAQIGKKVGKTAEHVLQLLALGDAGSDVRQMVSAGEVSATLAAKAARKHGEKAGEVLGEQLQTAKAQGKARVTPSTSGKTSASQARADSKHLDFLIAEGARVCQGSRSDLATPDGQHGYWLEWPSGATQPGIFETARLAIDTAIKQQITT